MSNGTRSRRSQTVTRLDGVRLYDPTFTEPSYHRDRFTEFDVVESDQSRRYEMKQEERRFRTCAKLRLR